MGQALSIIRDKRLYRTYGTFEEYCLRRWDLERRTAYQLINAAAVMENVRNCAHFLPANEAQARPLAQLKNPEQQKQAWQKVVETAPGGKITAEYVASVVEEIKPVKQKRQLAKRLSGAPFIEANSQSSANSDTIYTRPTSAEDEINHKAKGLGLPRNSEQVLPSSPPNDSIPTTSQTHTAALSNTAACAQGRPDVVAKEIAIGVKHISPEQLDWVITNAAHNGLSDQHLKAAIRAAKRALNSRHHPEYFNCKGH